MIIKYTKHNLIAIETWTIIPMGWQFRLKTYKETHISIPKNQCMPWILEMNRHISPFKEPIYTHLGQTQTPLTRSHHQRCHAHVLLWLESRFEDHIIIITLLLFVIVWLRARRYICGFWLFFFLENLCALQLHPLTDSLPGPFPIIIIIHNSFSCVLQFQL